MTSSSFLKIKPDQVGCLASESHVLSTSLTSLDRTTVRNIHINDIMLIEPP